MIHSVKPKNLWSIIGHDKLPIKKKIYSSVNESMMFTYFFPLSNEHSVLLSLKEGNFF